MHDLQQEMNQKHQRYINLQNDFNEICNIKTDLERRLGGKHEGVLREQERAEECELLRNKLNQFDQEIISNQDFIAKLQRELQDCQVSKGQLQARVDGLMQEQDGNKEGVAKQYQEEIIQISDEYQRQIDDLKKQVKAKDSEIEYHTNSIQFKKEKFEGDVDRVQSSEKQKASAMETRYLQQIQDLQMELKAIRDKNHEMTNQIADHSIENDRLKRKVGKYGQDFEHVVAQVGSEEDASLLRSQHDSLKTDYANIQKQLELYQAKCLELEQALNEKEMLLTKQELDLQQIVKENQDQNLKLHTTDLLEKNIAAKSKA